MRAVVPLLVALSAQASLARAQPAAPADLVAAAKAQADRIIEAGHAQRYFANVTASAVPTVRHLPSGMECAFTAGEPGRIDVYQWAGRPGDDVSCGTQVGTALRQRIVVTMYATRYPEPRTVDEDLAAALAEIRAQLPDARPMPGFDDAALEGAPPHKSVRLQASIDGQPSFTRAASAVVGSWVIAQRVTSELPAAAQADILGEILMNTTALGVARASGGAGPAGAKPPSPAAGA